MIPAAIKCIDLMPLNNMANDRKALKEFSLNK